MRCLPLILARSMVCWKKVRNNYGVITVEDLDGFSDDLKKLNTMGQEELVKIISDLFKTNKSVEARLNLMILGDEYGSELLEKYKKTVQNI